MKPMVKKQRKLNLLFFLHHRKSAAILKDMSVNIYFRFFFFKFFFRLSPVVVEPYNSLLATHFSMDYCDCTFIVDNEALYEICATMLDVPAPTYTNLNRIIGQVSWYSSILKLFDMALILLG